MPKKGKEQPKEAPKVEIKQEVPPPEVSLSPFASLNATAPFIHYKEYTKTYYETFKAADLKSADQFNGSPLNDQVKEIAAEFDQHTLQQLLSGPSGLIQNLTQFVRDHIDPATFKFIANCWPPVIPASNNDFIVYFLVALLHLAENPINILQWICRYIYPPAFTKTTQKFKAICRCKKDGKKAGFWAFLDNDNNFKLQNFKKIEVQTAFQGKIDAIEIAKDKITLQVKQGNKVVAKFVPEEPQQVQLWATVLKEPKPLIQFITSFKTPAVDEIYQIAYNYIVTADAQILRAALAANIIKPTAKEAKEVINAFLTCFTYGNKIPVLLSTLLINDFQDVTKDVNEIIAAPTHTKTVMNTIMKTYGTPYAKGFLTKLAKYIDSTGGCGLGTPNVDIAGVEAIVTNTIKFLCHSFNEVPEHIKYVLSFVRSFVGLRTNSQISMYNVVAQYFLKDYVLSELQNVKQLVPDVQHPEIFTPLTRLLYVIFSLGELNGEFEALQPLEKRLERHTFSLLIEFGVELSKVPEQDLNFPPPKPEPLARAIEAILGAMTVDVAKFQQLYTEVLEASGPTILGSNFAAMLQTEFIHEYDTQEPAIEEPEKPPEPKKKHSSKLIKASYFDPEELEGKTLHKVVPLDPNTPADPNSPRKYYKKVKKQVPRK